jgi:hypothetical protein
MGLAAAWTFGTAAVLLATAYLLWITNDDRAQGVALALIGSTAAHLGREATLVIKRLTG